MLLLAADFYYTKNIAGRRLVGLRWWNEVDTESGDSKWVFESSEPGTKVINPTDSRFFWLAMYIQPVIWVVMAIVAVFRFQFLWLPLVGEFLSHPLTLFHRLAYSRKGVGWDHEFSYWIRWGKPEHDGGLIAAFLVIALVLTIMNTLAFSRADKFSQASNLAGSAFSGGNLAGTIATNMVGRFFRS
jgi:hypothetical protein